MQEISDSRLAGRCHRQTQRTGERL